LIVIVVIILVMMTVMIDSGELCSDRL